MKTLLLLACLFSADYPYYYTDPKCCCKVWKVPDGTRIAPTWLKAYGCDIRVSEKDILKRVNNYVLVRPYSKMWSYTTKREIYRVGDVATWFYLCED